MQKTFRSVDIVVDAKFKCDKAGANTFTPNESTASPDYLIGFRDNPGYNIDNSFAAISFFLWCCSVAAEQPDDQERAIKLILPRTNGFLCKSDFLNQRLVQCDGVEKVQGFCQPRQYLRSQTAEEVQWDGLYQILGKAVGGILLSTPKHGNAINELSKLEVELDNRLSFPWMTPRPITRKTLAYVDARDRSTTETLLHAAKTLGIGIIVLGKPGHWLESPEAVHLRDHFVPFDMSIDASLPMRIVKALSGVGVEIDGLTTNYDFYVYPVAEAATFLGLPCEPLGAFDICRDKYRQHISNGDPAVRFTKMQMDKSGIDFDTDFPAIIKPSDGVNSEGVSKVRNHGELEVAVDRVFNSQYGHINNINAVSVEPYCDGPEVDANFVLYDGEVLFVEIADDFPKGGDQEEAGNSTSFTETAMLYPSGLPTNELEILKKSLHQTLLKFGFRSGVFHVEARVQNSIMQYGLCDGVLDLQPVVSSFDTKVPESFLIEVNPRLPGLMGTTAVHGTYGISYAALYLLIAIGDAERARALSQPFCAGPQFWSVVIFITSDKGGVFSSEDIGDELKRRHPDLWQSVSSYHCYFEKGQRVPDPAADDETWIGWFCLYSRVGRRHLLETSEQVRAEVRYELL